MAVITISRLFGAGGWTLASRLSTRLGYGCINENMIKEAASKLKVSSAQIQYFEKEGGSMLMRFIDKLVNTRFIDRHLSDSYGFVNEKNYVDVIGKIILEIHDKGNMIIIGRGGQFILKDFPDTVHLLLVQNMESRIAFMMENYNLTRPDAEKSIRQRDLIRRRFLGFFTDVEHIDDPSHYDLVLNMDRVGMDMAENLVVNLVEKKEAQPVG
ncbi:MAG: cytidylate kinase-like family protein [Desulfobacterales bacterium]